MYKLILMIVLGVLSNNITAQETNILKEHQSELMLQWSASLTPKDRKIAFTQFIDIFQIVKPNPNVEIESFIKQSESGDSNSFAFIAYMIWRGEAGFRKDKVAAKIAMMRALSEGSTQAPWFLAQTFLYSAQEESGKEQMDDFISAIQWLGVSTGLGESRSHEDAMHHIELTAKALSQGAEKNRQQIRSDLLRYYNQGLEGAKKYKNNTEVLSPEQSSLEKLQKEAAQGDDKAQTKLGKLYSQGVGIQKNATKAFEWTQKAAMQGNADAQFKLGMMYLQGNGVSKDFDKAAEWWKKAVAQGQPDAQFFLGMLNSRANDKVRAYAWFILAEANGYGKSEFRSNELREQIDLLEKSLTNVDRIEGRQLASNWKKGDSGLISNNGDTSIVEQLPIDKRIESIKSQKQSTGTAFVVSSEGHALTNHHVINGCAEVKVAGRDGVAKVITSDSVNDLALLQLPDKSIDIAKLKPEPGKVRQGEDVIVFGYPLNSVLSSGGNLTPGTLSALTGLGNNTNQIQITAPIQPGSSGSPVMDKKGNVMAVVSMKLDDGKMAKFTGQVGQNVNFAVSGQTVRAFLDTNNVPYQTGGGFFSHEMDNADIADEARKWTVLVECWK